MKRLLVQSLAAIVAILVIVIVISEGRRHSSLEVTAQTANRDLAGAWRARIQFQSGAYASVKDFEFMYTFNTGGTMMESSNYDAYPPVPPAYGVWRQTTGKQFEAHYEFYPTRVPEAKDSAAANAGWLPAGRGVLTERITLSDDGNSFTSEIKLEMFDPAGQAIEGGGTATGSGVRMGW